MHISYVIALSAACWTVYGVVNGYPELAFPSEIAFGLAAISICIYYVYKAKFRLLKATLDAEKLPEPGKDVEKEKEGEGEKEKEKEKEKENQDLDLHLNQGQDKDRESSSSSSSSGDKETRIEIAVVVASASDVINQ